MIPLAAALVLAGTFAAMLYGAVAEGTRYRGRHEAAGRWEWLWD